MANIVKEAFGKQLYINDAKYLDAKLQPVQTKDELLAMPRQQRFEGLEVMVLGEGRKYILSGGTKDSNWVPLNTGNDEMFWETDGNELDINK